MSVEEFLGGLPSFSDENFSKYNPGKKTFDKRSNTVYVPTKDYPSAQIVNVKEHDLLRPLHKIFGGKQMKRAEMSSGNAKAERNPVPSKRPRTSEC